MSTLSQYVVE